MLPAKVRLSKKAIADLESIWKYSAIQWSEKQANKYYLEIVEGIRKIVRKPRAGTNLSGILSKYWKYKVNSHFIFYCVGEKNKIEIVRILHQKMDLETNLQS
jgi:toxin ParE1/3/4